MFKGNPYKLNVSDRLISSAVYINKCFQVGGNKCHIIWILPFRGFIVKLIFDSIKKPLIVLIYKIIRIVQIVRKLEPYIRIAPVKINLCLRILNIYSGNSVSNVLNVITAKYVCIPQRNEIYRNFFQVLVFKISYRLKI